MTRISIYEEPENKQFPVGELVLTTGAFEVFSKAKQDPTELLKRHQLGDWGDLDEADRQQNERNVKRNAGRILSRYTLTSGAVVYVTTEADRSVTTILLPGEW